MGATWERRPHNFLAVGAIAPIAAMELAPMGGIWGLLNSTEQFKSVMNY